MCVCVTSCSCCCQICDRVVCVCGSFVRRRLSMTFELVGICVRFFFSLGAFYLLLGNFTKLFVQSYVCVTQGRS